MKMRVVSSKSEISTLGQSEQIIHLSFRPSNTDVLSLVKKCPKIKALHVPPSYKRTISTSTELFLSVRGVALLEGDVWGHRKDINEYSEISQSIYDCIDQYRKDGFSDDEIGDKMSRELHMGEDFIRFLIKNRK